MNTERNGASPGFESGACSGLAEAAESAVIAFNRIADALGFRVTVYSDDMLEMLSEVADWQAHALKAALEEALL